MEDPLERALRWLVWIVLLGAAVAAAILLLQ